ncbi:hypothetical protein GQ44DRAFT_598083, partial [Phaeosphaeriaceae sp. PMI808]
RALRGYEKAWGPDHASTLDTVNNLGALYADQGKPDDAEKMYERALRGKEKALGSEQVLTYIPTLNTMQNLAFLLSSVGRTDEAKELYTRAQGGIAMIAHHSLTLTSFNNLAMVLQYQGKYDEVEKL